MSECICAYPHCCHTEKEQEIISDANEFGFRFLFTRTLCAVCRCWIGDIPLHV